VKHPARYPKILVGLGGRRKPI